MNAFLRKLSLVSVLASGVALAQSTPPPATGGPSTGNSTEPQPRPRMESDKPATGMGNDNAGTPATAAPNRTDGTGGSGATGASAPSTSTKKSANKKHKATTGNPGTDTSSNGNAK